MLHRPVDSITFNLTATRTQQPIQNISDGTKSVSTFTSYLKIILTSLSLIFSFFFEFDDHFRIRFSVRFEEAGDEREG